MVMIHLPTFHVWKFLMKSMIPTNSGLINVLNYFHEAPTKVYLHDHMNIFMHKNFPDYYKLIILTLLYHAYSMLISVTTNTKFGQGIPMMIITCTDLLESLLRT